MGIERIYQLKRKIPYVMRNVHAVLTRRELTVTRGILGRHLMTTHGRIARSRENIEQAFRGAGAILLTEGSGNAFYGHELESLGGKKKN